MTNKPKAVLVSDIHFSLNTLQEASLSMFHAIDKALDLEVPIIVAGDLHDSKANMRAECVNKMLDIFQHAAEHTSVYIMVGNHDKINEKSVEHSLNFLKPHALIVNNTRKIKDLGLYLIPYFSDPDALRTELRLIPKGSTLIMHQGIIGSDSGEYIIDKSAINKEDVADFRVISGHYHKRQTIKTGRPQKGSVGLWDYIGNPYSLGFGEANDPPKGFQILYDDGSLEFVPTNLRKHWKFDVKATYNQEYNVVALSYQSSHHIYSIKEDDLVWLRVTGKQSDLKDLNKESIKEKLSLPSDFRLELIPDEVTTERQQDAVNLPKDQLLDKMIESLSNTSEEQKERLKTLWKLLLEG